MGKKKTPICYNCKHGGGTFKIGRITHLHCQHPKMTEEDAGWGTLEEWWSTCKDHEFKNPETSNQQQETRNPCNPIKK